MLSTYFPHRKRPSPSGAALPPSQAPRLAGNRLIFRDEFFQNSKDFFVAMQEARNRDSTIMLRENYVVDPPKETKLLGGEQRFLAIEDMIKNGFDKKPWGFQIKLVDMILLGCARTIMGDDWETAGPKLLRERKKTGSLQRLTVASTPRQFGKSTLVIHFIVALAVHMEGTEIAIFGSGVEITKTLMQRIVGVMRQHNLSHLIGRKGLKMNQREMEVVSAHNPKAKNKITCYSTDVNVSSVCTTSFPPFLLMTDC